MAIEQATRRRGREKVDGNDARRTRRASAIALKTNALTNALDATNAMTNASPEVNVPRKARTATRRAPATRVSVPGVVTGVTANAVEKLNEKSDGGVSAGDERITGDAEARGSARGGAASASAREGKKTSVKATKPTARSKPRPSKADDNENEVADALFDLATLAADVDREEEEKGKRKRPRAPPKKVAKEARLAGANAAATAANAAMYSPAHHMPMGLPMGLFPPGMMNMAGQYYTPDQFAQPQWLHAPSLDQFHVPARKPYQNCAMHVYIAHFIDFTQQESRQAMIQQEQAPQLGFGGSTAPAAAAYFAGAAQGADGDGQGRGSTEGLGTSGMGQFMPPMGVFPPMMNPHLVAAMMQFAPPTNSDGTVNVEMQAQMSQFLAFMMHQAQAQFAFPGAFPGALPSGMSPFPMFPLGAMPPPPQLSGELGYQPAFFPPPMMGPNNPMAAMMMAGIPPQVMMEMMMHQAAVAAQPPEHNRARSIKEEGATEKMDKGRVIANIHNGVEDDAKSVAAAQVPETKAHVEVSAK